MYFKEIVLAKIINSHLTFLKPTKSIKYIFNLNIQEDIKNSVFDKINELSEKSRLLLEKGPAYQNDIKSVYVAGWVFQEEHMKKYTFTLCCLQQI